MNIANSSVFNDRYELIRLIGKGATGLVYLAYDSHLDREVAIKVLDTHVSENIEVIQRFEQEVRITARLQHPGVVSVFESGESSEGMPCYAMSLALGQTMEEYLEFIRDESEDSWDKFSLIERLSIFIKLLEVMRYAHSEHTVHRDLKPANIILGEFGEVRVLDWGLGRTLKTDEGSEVVEEFDDMFGSDEAGGTSKIRKSEPRMTTPQLRGDSHVSNPQLDHSNPDAKFAETLIPGTFIDDADAGPSAGPSADSSADSSADPSADLNTDHDNPASDDGKKTHGNYTGSYSSDRIAIDEEANARETVAEGSRHFDKESPDYTSDDEPMGEISGEYPKQNWYEEYDETTDNLRPNTDHNIPDDDPSMSQSDKAISTSRRRSRETGTSSRVRRSVRMDSSHIERRTRFGEILGSPVYMSPEQARGEADRADRRTDIYSLGVILFELLTLKTPQSMESGEKLSDFIERVINGKGKRLLADEWTDAPQALCDISKKALARQVNQRYRSCSELMADIHLLLEELSASYSELERQRLEQDRQGAWIPVGNWDYTGEEKRMKPFTEMVSAFEGEAVGQLLHHDRGGMLFGGCGLQIYPCAVNVGDDIRVNMEFSVLHGSEIWIFLRGIPPISCYAFRIGSHDGRWLTISKVQSVEKIFQPEMLTMRALSDAEATALFSRKKKRRKRRLDIEIVGSTLRIAVDGEDPLIVQDPCPLIGPMHQQLALGTVGTQIVVHNFSIEQRRSPLMVPSYEVANELLRQNLYPQAITYYQKFLEEQLEVDQRVEAHFMLCLAFQQAGHLEQSEQELHNFLLENIDHRLSRDAIFELARLRTGNNYKRIESGVRVVLSYQEADDRVRSRFCLWASDLLHDTIFVNGIDDSVLEALRLMKHLVRGFSDETVLLDTISGIVIKSTAAFGAHLIDLQAYEQFDEFNGMVKKCRGLGYDLYPEFPHAPIDYLKASREVTAAQANNGDITHIYKICKPFSSPRDIICLNAFGCAESLIGFIEEDHRNRPVMILCLAALYARIGNAEKSKEMLEECFKLMDIIENERTNVEMTTVMRLGMYGLDFLPWQVIWPPISQMTHEPELQVLTAWLAECLGQHEQALEAYSFLRDSDAIGFRNVIEQALARLDLLAESKVDDDES